MENAAVAALEKHCSSKAFKKYLESLGVREYRHFAHLPLDYIPSLADVAMYMYESLGKKALSDLDIFQDVSCKVFAGGENLGISQFAVGKFTKDLTISMWLEDAGQMGFNLSVLEQEMDEALGEGWFKDHVKNRITKDITFHNRVKEVTEDERMLNKPLYKKWYQTLWTKFVETPSRYRVKFHYFMLKSRWSNRYRKYKGMAFTPSA